MNFTDIMSARNFKGMSLKLSIGPFVTDGQSTNLSITVTEPSLIAGILSLCEDRPKEEVQVVTKTAATYNGDFSFRDVVFRNEPYYAAAPAPRVAPQAFVGVDNQEPRALNGIGDVAVNFVGTFARANAALDQLANAFTNFNNVQVQVPDGLLEAPGEAAPQE